MTPVVSNPENLLLKIQHEFPDLSWKSFTYLDHGWDHEVLLLDNKLVFRFPNSPEYRAVLRDEIDLLEHLGRQTLLRIPQYTYIANDSSFAGYALIAGEELTQSRFQSLSLEDRGKAARQLAQFFSMLHSTPIDEVKKYNVGKVKPFEYEIGELSAKYLKPVLSSAEFLSVERVIKEIARIEATNMLSVLTHSDISPKHIIWDNERKKIGIIDFSDRCIADPAVDFAELCSYGEGFVGKVYELYEGPKDPSFLERAKAYQKRVGVYLMVDSYRTRKISFSDAKRVFDEALQL